MCHLTKPDRARGVWPSKLADWGLLLVILWGVWWLVEPFVWALLGWRYIGPVR